MYHLLALVLVFTMFTGKTNASTQGNGKFPFLVLGFSPALHNSGLIMLALESLV